MYKIGRKKGRNDITSRNAGIGHFSAVLYLTLGVDLNQVKPRNFTLYSSWRNYLFLCESLWDPNCVEIEFYMIQRHTKHGLINFQ